MKGSDELTRIKGVGVKTAGAFAAHGIRTADDLLGFYLSGLGLMVTASGTAVKLG